MTPGVTIRDAIETDLPAVLGIYNEVIANTTAVYSEAPVTLADRKQWWQARLALGYPLLVAEHGGQSVAFAAFGDFRAWPCYRYTVEHSVHVHAAFRGRGVGSGLIAELLLRAAALGKHMMIAGIDADNSGSITVHERLGFARCAHFREVGYKFGRWLDLVFMQKLISDSNARH
jgi:L-amino acid N-acyltransferase